MIKPWAVCVAALGMAGLAFNGCGGSGGPQGGGPVASTPLAGNIDGRPFTPISALAVTSSFFDGGVRWFNVYEQAASCANTNPSLPLGGRSILSEVPYNTGQSYNLSFGGGGHTVTFVVNRDSGYDNLIAFNGRIEVISAPQDAGSIGKIGRAHV